MVAAGLQPTQASATRPGPWPAARGSARPGPRDRGMHPWPRVHPI